MTRNERDAITDAIEFAEGVTRDQAPAPRKLHVLLVEDEREAMIAIREYMRILFKFEVTTAANGAEAMRALETCAADVILLDLRMPIMDGYEFLARYDGSVPIIVMSGFDPSVETLPRAPFGYIVKPLDMPEAKALILKAVANGNASVPMSAERREELAQRFIEQHAPCGCMYLGSERAETCAPHKCACGGTGADLSGKCPACGPAAEQGKGAAK